MVTYGLGTLSLVTMNAGAQYQEQSSAAKTGTLPPIQIPFPCHQILLHFGLVEQNLKAASPVSTLELALKSKNYLLK